MIGLLNFRGVSLPPSCTGGYYFANEVAIISISLGAWLVAVALRSARRSYCLGDRALKLAVRACVTAAVYLHPTASSIALSLVNCRNAELTGAALAVLEGGNPATAKARVLASVFLLQGGEKRLRPLRPNCSYR